MLALRWPPRHKRNPHELGGGGGKQRALGSTTTQITCSFEASSSFKRTQIFIKLAARFHGLDSWCKATQIQPVIRWQFRVCCIRLKCILLQIPLKWLVILLKSWTSTSYFSNSTGSSVTNHRLFPDIHMIAASVPPTSKTQCRRAKRQRQRAARFLPPAPSGLKEPPPAPGALPLARPLGTRMGNADWPGKPGCEHA